MCAFTQRARVAEMAQSDFGRALSGAERRMERAAMELARTRRLLEREDMAGAFGSAFAFSAEVEKLALLARVLPAYTGHPKAAELTEQMLLDTVPIEMGYAKRGWFLLKIPALLPKKGTGSPIYIQQYLYPALRRYFDGKPPALYRSCVLAYRHVYQHDRPERAYRDHDNIEVNMVTDIVTLYLMPDDAPRRCAHYYCSAAGEEDCTEVYVVPASRFPEWLAAAQAALEATSQDAIDEATKTLREARLNARTKADISALEELVAYVNSLDLRAYTLDSVVPVNRMMSKLTQAMNDEEITQEKVDELAAEMQAAIDGLQPVSEGSVTTPDTTDTAAGAMSTTLFALMAAAGAAVVAAYRRKRS